MTLKSYHAGLPPTTATPESAWRQELSRLNAVRIAARTRAIPLGVAMTNVKSQRRIFIAVAIVALFAVTGVAAMHTVPSLRDR